MPAGVVEAPQDHRIQRAPETRTHLPTPIKVQALSRLLEGYKDRHDIIQGFTEGFKIDFEGQDAPLHSRNSASANEHPEIVTAKLQNERLHNRIEGPFPSPPFKNCKSSPLAIREKAEPEKYRSLHNLSYPYDHNSVNFNIPKHSSQVQYASIQNAIHGIQKFNTRTFMAKADIADAFRLIPLHPSQYHLTGFYWKGYWFDKCLPMGCSQSCKIFESFSDCLQWILLNKFDIPSVKLLGADHLMSGAGGGLWFFLKKKDCLAKCQKKKVCRT